jgi:hypothetical protein
MSCWQKGLVCDVLGRRLRHLGGVAWRIGACPLGAEGTNERRALSLGER